MPDVEFELTESEALRLEEVRRQQGLESLSQAAEWLVKQRLRKASQRLTGRNRALYPVKRR